MGNQYNMPSFAQAWMAQWRKAASSLETQRYNDLVSMNDDDARNALMVVLDFAEHLAIPSSRLHYSGLVEQQKFFHRNKLPHE